MIAFVSAANIEEFSYFLKDKLLKIKGVRSTVTSVVLNAYKGSREKNGA